jgi:hypothetical protein
MQPPAFAAQRLFGAFDGGLQRRGTGAQRHVSQAGRKGGPVGLADLARAELFQTGACDALEGRGIDVVQRHADDAAARDEAGAGQMEQAGQQLAARQVAGGTEQHHHLGMSRADARGDLGHAARAPG